MAVDSSLTEAAGEGLGADAVAEANTCGFGFPFGSTDSLLTRTDAGTCPQKN